MQTILLIDDDAFTRNFAVRSLENPETRVVTAEGGRRGVELAGEHAPSLILCDIEMPDMDGFATLESIRSNPHTRHVPFIFLTGRSEREDVRRGMDLGADDYLTKPFTVEELRTAVTARLRKHEEALGDQKRALDELCRSIADSFPHELRTPLSVIMGASQFLREGRDIEEPTRIAMLDSIETAATRLHRLAENFLLFIRLASSPCEANERGSCAHQIPEPGPLITRRARAEALLAQRGNDLVLSVADAPVCTTPGELSKIVEELLRNAVQFSKPDTPIHVFGAPTEAGYRLTIADRGRGMHPGDIARVGAFRQFQRGLYEQQGVGLGLTLITRLAERHHGRITIESTPGVGTTVHVDLRPGDRVGAEC